MDYSERLLMLAGDIFHDYLTIISNNGFEIDDKTPSGFKVLITGKIVLFINIKPTEELISLTEHFLDHIGIWIDIYLSDSDEMAFLSSIKPLNG